MIISLAECQVLLRPEFSAYVAYIILSAREHPGNIDNSLDDEAQKDPAKTLFQYLRRRVRPGTPDWAYLESWAEEIRRLPIYNTMVEAEYRRLQVRSAVFDGGKQMENVGQQMREWHALSPEMRRHVALAHPKFRPGVSK